tara:strand:- start:1649 stop:2896 length:1248 start_codon:yes stop_codon:yes gene_type:complete
MKNLLTIVIPTWNNLDMLRICVESLFLYTKYPFEVIIIDNGCKGEVEKALPDSARDYVKVIEPEKNLGWMKAHNLALESVETPYYCLLNDDVVFIPAQWDFWTKLISHLNEKVGAVGPASNFVAGNQSIHLTNVPLVCDSSFLIGFCMIIKTDVFKEIGGLDVDLPGGDDLDLSIRLMNEGYILRVDKSAYLHHWGQSTGKRVHGENWDSLLSQEITNNALMSKHGVKSWINCSKAYWTNPEDWGLSNPLTLEDNWYKDEVAKFNGSTGLNIGCGHKKIEGTIGVDIRPSGELGEGGERLKESSADIVAEATDIPLDDSSQPYIIAAHVLEHMIDPIDALEEWHRLLAPGGSLFITLPDHAMENTLVLDYTHVHAYTTSSLDRLVKAVGFEVISIEQGAFNTIRAICKKPEGALV